MRIKPSYRLQLADLPLVESPSAAARTVAGELSNSSAGHWLLPGLSDVPGVHSATSRETLHRTLIARIASGELCLVHSGVGSDVPRQPVVSWSATGKSDGDKPGVGHWRCEAEGQQIAGLVDSVAALNRRRMAPSDLRAGAGLGASSLGQSQGGFGEVGQSHTAVRDQDHRLSLPLGASAQVMPLAARKGQGDAVEEPRGIHLVAGLFTDGTLNNVDNIETFRKRLIEECIEPLAQDASRLEECRERLGMRLGESYANGPTNVVKLFDLYKEQTVTVGHRKTLSVKAYEPGAGTKTGDDDSVIGMATGLGETGVPEQVGRLFKAIAARSAIRLEGKPVDELSVDLFGFSRGAAASRHAIQEILKGRPGGLAHALSEQGITWPDEVTVRFVGLFDTVAGIVNLSGLDLSAGNDRNSPVELYLDPEKVDHVVHLVAADERRANFALNSVRSSDGSLPENFREITLPGAHSDVGGGYHDLETETVLLHPTLTIQGSQTSRPRQTMMWDTLESLRAKVESEDWIGAYSLPLVDGSAPMLELEERHDEHPVPDGRVELSLSMTRRIRGDYSRISFRLMHELAINADIPLAAIDETDPGMRLPDELVSIFEELSQKLDSGEHRLELKTEQSDMLRQRYLHHSDHYNPIKWLMAEQVARMEVPAAEFLHPLRSASSGKRTIHFNNRSG